MIGRGGDFFFFLSLIGSSSSFSWLLVSFRLIEVNPFVGVFLSSVSYPGKKIQFFIGDTCAFSSFGFSTTFQNYMGIIEPLPSMQTAARSRP